LLVIQATPTNSAVKGEDSAVLHSFFNSLINKTGGKK
jgi:hypothetical protein